MTRNNLAPSLAAIRPDAWVWLDDDDMRRLGAAGASVSHNPGSNAMLAAGMNLAIGTDGANCADSLNMYEAMRAAIGPTSYFWTCATPTGFRSTTS